MLLLIGKVEVKYSLQTIQLYYLRPLLGLSSCKSDQHKNQRLETRTREARLLLTVCLLMYVVVVVEWEGMLLLCCVYCVLRSRPDRLRLLTKYLMINGRRRERDGEWVKQCVGCGWQGEEDGGTQISEERYYFLFLRFRILKMFLPVSIGYEKCEEQIDNK